MDGIKGIQVVVLRKIGVLFVLVISSFLFSGCTSSGVYYDDNYYEGGEGYEEDLVTSDNWECTDDCGGHEAGYEWASDNGITDPDDCGGKSNSFIEGCEAYANEQTIDEGYNDYEYEEDYYY